jgi:hypothetical protein
MRPRAATPGKTRLQRVLTVLAWLGLALSIALLAAALWFHVHLDPIVRLPFVLVCGGGGFMLGMSSVGYLLTGKFH